MTEDARPIPDPLARELRALNDLELGAVIADLGVDPLKPPGAKLRGALASIAEDADPWWEGSLAGHAVDCLAKEPRRGRIAGGGAVDHARATWEGLARLGAAARPLIPDHDREGEAAGVRSVIGAMEAELRAIRDFTGRADPVEGCKLLADEVAARGAKLAEWRDWAHGTGTNTDPRSTWCGRAAALRGHAPPDVRAEDDELRGTLALGIAAGEAAQNRAPHAVAELSRWEALARQWCGEVADLREQVRIRMHALAEVRAVPGAAYLRELAPSVCPAAEVPRRMGRIWDALARDAAARDAAAHDAAASALIEIGRAAGTIGTGLPWADLARATVAEIERLKRALRGWYALAEDALVEDAPAEPAPHAYDNVARRLAAGERAQREVDAARRSLGCPDGVALSEWVARSAPERAADALIASRDAALAREADAVAELLRWRQWAVKVAPESAEGTNDGLRGRVGWLVVSHRERAATEEAAHHGLAAAVEALGDAARDALAAAEEAEIPPGAAERVALLARRYRELRERLGREGLLAALERLAEARDELRRWRSWAGLAGRLPPAVAAARGDGELRAAIDTALSGAEGAAAELAKSQRARKSLEGRFAAAHEEGRLEAEALHKARIAELDAWRQWARACVVAAAVRGIANDGGMRIELSRLLEAQLAVAKALRAPPSADLAGMVEAIRAAAGPSTLSGPGALAEQVARLREAADIARSTPEIGAEAIASLREIAALVRDA